jgi:hypothetical protein
MRDVQELLKESRQALCGTSLAVDNQDIEHQDYTNLVQLGSRRGRT